MAERSLAFQHFTLVGNPTIPISSVTQLTLFVYPSQTMSVFPTEFSMIRSDSVTSLASTAKLEAEGSRADEWASVQVTATGTMEFTSVPASGNPDSHFAYS
eukprot:6171409-Amphidinium_carterae.1